MCRSVPAAACRGRPGRCGRRHGDDGCWASGCVGCWRGGWRDGPWTQRLITRRWFEYQQRERRTCSLAETSTTTLATAAATLSAWPSHHALRSVCRRQRQLTHTNAQQPRQPGHWHTGYNTPTIQNFRI